MSKTIRAFEGPHLNKMFHGFSDSEQSRLNRGVRGRLVEHCKYLIRSNNLKGFDANSIFESTRELAYEEDYKNDAHNSGDESDNEYPMQKCKGYDGGFCGGQTHYMTMI